MNALDDARYVKAILTRAYNALEGSTQRRAVGDDRPGLNPGRSRVPTDFRFDFDWKVHGPCDETKAVRLCVQGTGQRGITTGNFDDRLQNDANKRTGTIRRLFHHA